MDAVSRLRAMLPEQLLARTGVLPENLTELRVRAGRPVEIVSLSGDTLCKEAVPAELVARTAQALAGHSLYAREEELKEGFFTIEGGCRVGVCGRMTAADGRVAALTHVGSVNVRVARPVPGVADRVMSALYQEGRPLSALVISPPGLGKTTLLRDIARQLSDGTDFGSGVAVALADERGELAGCRLGIPTLEVGVRTDVMDGCPKRLSIPLLVRAMSPSVLVTDELGHPGDAQAVLDAMRCGVRVVASAHARDEAEAETRLGADLTGAFDRIIVLGGAVGQVRRIGKNRVEG